MKHSATECEWGLWFSGPDGLVFLRDNKASSCHRISIFLNATVSTEFPLILCSHALRKRLRLSQKGSY